MKNPTKSTLDNKIAAFNAYTLDLQNFYISNQAYLEEIAKLCQEPTIFEQILDNYCLPFGDIVRNDKSVAIQIYSPKKDLNKWIKFLNTLYEAELLTGYKINKDNLSINFQDRFTGNITFY